ncbi:MAG: MFS transporter, partial [Legionellales bacterium]|nr:MFS transporter [Legionellales bacterium]
MSKMKYKEIFTAGIGSGLEYYDFIIFGFFAPIFAPLFFPADNQFLAVLWGYSAFAVGFIFRPIGGVLFGHIGDRLGRKSALSYSILFMGLGTLLIGILPTYNQIGILAPILLILARIIQGISIGGEFAGGKIFSVEHGSIVNRKGFAGALVIFGAMGGTLSASVANYVYTISPWMSWRLPFIIGFLISIVGLYIRKRIMETDAFENVKANNKIRKYPIVDGIKKYPKLIAGTTILSWFGVAVFVSYWIFLPSYLKTILPEINPAIIDLSVPISIFICMLTVLVVGHITDGSVKRSTIIKIFVPSLAFFLLYTYSNLHNLTLTSFLISQFIFGILNGAWASAMGTYTVEILDDIEIRYSSYAFSTNLGEILGGLTPLIATILISTYHSSFLGAFICSVGMLALFAICKISKI